MGLTASGPTLAEVSTESPFRQLEKMPIFANRSGRKDEGVKGDSSKRELDLLALCLRVNNLYVNS